MVSNLYLSFFSHLFFKYFCFSLLRSLNVSVFLACSVSEHSLVHSIIFIRSHIFILFFFSLSSSLVCWFCFFLVFPFFVLFCLGSDWWCNVVDITPDSITSLSIILSVQRWVSSLKTQLLHIAFHYCKLIFYMPTSHYPGRDLEV